MNIRGVLKLMFILVHFSSVGGLCWFRPHHVYVLINWECSIDCFRIGGLSLLSYRVLSGFVLTWNMHVIGYLREYVSISRIMLNRLS